MAFRRTRLAWKRGLLTVAALAVAGVTSAVSPAAAEYRSCHATYVIRPSDGHGEIAASSRFSGRAPVLVGPPLTNVGAIQLNDARERARRLIEECVASHWAFPASATAPAVCVDNDGPGLAGMHNYPFANLVDGVTDLICAANPGQGRIVVDIFVSVDGNTGCIPPPNRWAIEVTEAYPILCPAARTIVPVPDLRPVVPDTEDFVLPDDRESKSDPAGVAFLPGIRLPGNDIGGGWIGLDGTWRRCVEMCDTTPGCNAWTWRGPGTTPGSPEAGCLLKSRAGARVADPCCHSGIMQ